VAGNVRKSGRKGLDAALVTALAAGGSLAAAAAHAGCSERTVYRRLQDPEFKARVQQARADMVEQAVGQLSALGGMATQALQGLLKDQAGAVRLGAARTVLEHMFRAAQLDNLQRLVAEMQTELGRLRRHHEHQPGGTRAPAANGRAGGEPEA
jgi:AraC-like DNA-binding protein